VIFHFNDYKELRNYLNNLNLNWIKLKFTAVRIISVGWSVDYSCYSVLQVSKGPFELKWENAYGILKIFQPRAFLKQ
jgi:hypothetical protein